MAKTSASRVTKAAQSHAGGFDYWLLLAVAALVTVGLVMVYSTTFDWANQTRISVGPGKLSHIERQIISTAAGAAIAAVVTFIPYDWWRRAAIPVMLLTLAVLILVLIVGDDVNGARRTFFEGRVQASEVAKLGMVIYIAAWLASKGEQVRDVTLGLVPFAVLIGVISALIVLQPDHSVAILIIVTALAMLFLAGADLLQLGAIGAIGSAAFYILAMSSDWLKERIGDFWALWRDPSLVNDHLREALIALGSGGLVGVGLGHSQQKLGYLPAPHTDSIFAVLGEETGFVGCAVVIALFAVVAYRGFRLAMQTTDPFASLLAGGVTCWITFQAAMNLGVITGLLPFTGSALPFVTYGGSSMVVTLVGVGLLLSISRSRRARNPLRGGEPSRASMDRGRRDRGTRVPRPGGSRRAVR
jgi:cell division protein FtsW